MEFSKESGIDATRSSQILFVKLGDGFLSVGQVLGRFPGVIAFGVAFPADKVLELASENTTVNNCVNFVFLFALNLYRFRK